MLVVRRTAGSVVAVGFASRRSFPLGTDVCNAGRAVNYSHMHKVIINSLLNVSANFINELSLSVLGG